LPSFKICFFLRAALLISYTKAMKTTQELAQLTVEHCRANTTTELQAQYYSDDCTSTETSGPAGRGIVTQVGKEAIAKKGTDWYAMVETMHSAVYGEPLVTDTSFCFTLTADITFKDGRRVHLSELCAYQCADGKIVAELFI
jgi:hypothetical protein